MKQDPLPNPLPKTGEGAMLPISASSPALAAEGWGEGLLSIARRLRRDMTPAERVLWKRLRASGLGLKAKRQVPFGPYVLDFAFLADRLVVEVDGDTHATTIGIRADAARDAFLDSRGFRVLRVSNRDIFGNPDGVLGTIRAALR